MKKLLFIGAILSQDVDHAVHTICTHKGVISCLHHTVIVNEHPHLEPTCFFDPVLHAAVHPHAASAAIPPLL